jgi:PhnB protein
MKIDAYVIFGGRAAEAVAFYQEHLGASAIQAMPFRGTPGGAAAPEEWQDKILHVSMTSEHACMPGKSPSRGMQACSLALSADSTAQAERIFAALAQDGAIEVPLGPSFFAERFGMVTDQFGVSWMIIHAVPA